VLASALIAGYPRVIILDIKYDFPIPKSWDKDTYRIASTPPGLKQGILDRLKPDPWGRSRVIYRPKPPYDSGAWITYFLDWCFRKGRAQGKKKPFILYLDEGGWTAYSGAKLAMSRLAIAGRSLGIGLWIASQRPRGIPVEVRSEAWRMYIFYLRNRKDRIEIMDNIGEIWLTDDRLLDEYDIAQTPESYEFAEIRRVEGGRMVYRLMPPISMK